jgi:tetratricopeptide (TPR) repeat protein
MQFKTLIFIFLTATLIFAQNDKRTIGLMPFENKTGSSSNDWVSYGMEYLLSNKLAVISGFYLPSKDLMSEAISEAGFGTRSTDERMIYHIGKNASVEVIITGSYKMAGQTLSLNVIYYNTFNGSVIMTETITETIDNLFQISTRIVRRLVELAGITISSTEERLIGFTMTSSIKAFESFVKAYMEDSAGKGRTEVVTGLFRQAIREDPKFWEAYYNLGIVYFNNQNYSQALEQFNRVIEALPRFDKSYYGRGLIYERQKEYDKAIADFQMVTELNPNDYKPYYNLGKISLDQKNYAEAESYLEKAEELNPYHAPTF